MTSRNRTRRLLAALAAAPLLVGLSACGASSTSAAASSGSSVGADTGTAASELRLGFFANVTHATPLVADKEGFFTKELGSTKLTISIYNAGPAAIEALNSGSIDAAYLGPNPAINGYTKSDGKSLRIIAGATSGGAALVVRSSINSAADLKGKTLDSPQLGGTQDVALRAWLNKNGLKVPAVGKGDLTIQSTDNATTLQLFQDGKIDGAWLPEPWASRLVLDAGAKVLVNEKTLWPEGKFVTTQLIVSQDFLAKHPATVEALLKGEVTTNAFIAANPDKAKADINAELLTYTKKSLKPAVLDSAFANIAVTNDPLAATLKQAADNAVGAGLLKAPKLDGIYDLRLLNRVLAAAGQPAVDDAGLGVKQ